MKKLTITVTVSRQMALQRGVTTYGDFVLEPTDEQLRELDAEERIDLFTRKTPCNGWLVSEPTWGALLDSYRELRREEREREEQNAILRVRYVDATALLSWDEARLEVVRSVNLPYLDCAERRGYNDRINELVCQGVEAADRVVESIDRATQIRRVARAAYERRPVTPRSEALIEEEERRKEALERAELRAHVAHWLSAEQLERFDARVLPTAELKVTVGVNLWREYTYEADNGMRVELPRYRPLEDSDVFVRCADDGDDDEYVECEVERHERMFSVEGAEFSADEWRALQRVRAAVALNGGAVELIEFTARCKESGHSVSRRGVRVTRELVGLSLKRTFALEI